MKKITIASLLVVSVLFFSYGVLVGHYKIFPYEFLSDLKLNENKSAEQDYSSQIYETNVDSLIHIHNESDASSKRDALIGYIWSEKGFPDKKLPDDIQKSILDSRYDDLENLKSIDKITISMDKGVESIAYLFNPNKSQNTLIIYHQGHDGDFIKGKDTIQFFLNKGYPVLAFSMPLLGMNDQPIVDTQFGRIKLITHDHFQLIESPDLSPIKYFVEPIAVSLNYLDEMYDFDSYYMVGLSGGGWTATLYSAIDPRISQSYSIAGSVPIYLRSIPQNAGDYEQMLSSLYKNADYLDLYILASYGQGRKHVQIFNKYDSCCFGGEVYKTYADKVKSAVSDLGKGYFDVHIDDSHRGHKISENSLNFIYDSMKN